MSYATGLTCRECARSFPAEALHVCDFCFGPLEVAYDYRALRAATSRARIASGPQTIWRYSDLLPVDDPAPIDLGAGMTPLVRADRLASELGLGELWIKDDTHNPTGSFKDRVVSVALTKAREGVYVTERVEHNDPVSSLALVRATETTRSLNEPVGLWVSSLIHSSPSPSSDAKRSALTSGVMPAPRSIGAGSSTGRRSEYLQIVCGPDAMRPCSLRL